MEIRTDAVDERPASVFRQVVYRPHAESARRVLDRFEVLARPGERFAGMTADGDVVVRAELGGTGPGMVEILTGGPLERRNTSVANLPAGMYAASRAGIPVRLCDVHGRVPFDQLLLRQRNRVAGPGIKGASAEQVHGGDPRQESTTDDRRPVPIDAAAAVPPFDAAQRSRLSAVLSAPALERAAQWNVNAHPRLSGVLLDEIRSALGAYVDESAVRTALGRHPGGRDWTEAEVLAESVHQFQVKCYREPALVDARAGESTLDSLGLIARTGSAMHGADVVHSGGLQRLQGRDVRVRAATGGEFGAANWFSALVDPSFLGLTTKLGRGLHTALVRRLRAAERALLAKPAYRGMTPVALGAALGITERHGGARPTQTQSTSVHTFGLAIDIEYTANPWVVHDASWAALRRASHLISGVRLAQASAPAYWSSLGTDPRRSTTDVWDEVRRRSDDLAAYAGLAGDVPGMADALRAGLARGTAGLMLAGEPLEDAARRWAARATADRRALIAGDFTGHRPPERGFLTHSRDLVVALRDTACLAWGAVDLGAGARGSGDIMHFDMRVDGAGRVLVEGTTAHVPTRGHPCLARAAGSGDVVDEEIDAGTGLWRAGRAGDEESAATDRAKSVIRAQSSAVGTDERAVLAALGALTPAQMAELLEDGAVIGVLLAELSGSDLATVSVQLARGRVGSMGRVDIDRIIAAPRTYSLATLAGAMTRDVLLAHQDAVDRTGTGTIHGSHCPSPRPAGATSADCTTYVTDVLARAFAAKGQATQWRDTMAAATRASGASGLKGTEVIRALQDRHGWGAAFWAPDPTDPQDGMAEHPYAYRIVQRSGTYYGITVDRSKSVLNYRRTRAANPTDLSGIERLRRLPFAVLAARGGMHMALVVNGAVYEVHWTAPATDRDAVQATPLETFAWQSGVVASTPGSLDLAWRTP